MTVRTLIVDDDVRVADIHKGYVERVEGFEVAGVANRGTEALRRVLDDQPDLVLLDIYLPDLGGLEVCRRLRAAGNLVDVIAVTAARDVDTVKARSASASRSTWSSRSRSPRSARSSSATPRTARTCTRGGEAEQEEIDAMLGELRSASATPAAEGPQPETLELVAARSRTPTRRSAPPRSPTRRA